MMQIATIQVAPQSPATETTLSQEPTNQFTPHLEKAVTEATQLNSNTSSKTLDPTDSVGSTITSALEDTGSLFDPVFTDDSGRALTADQNGENLFVPPEPGNDEKKVLLLSAKVHEQKPGDIFTEQNPVSQTPEQSVNLQVPGNHIPQDTPGRHISQKVPTIQVYQEVAGKALPSSPADKDLPALSRSKIDPAFTGQAIKTHTPDRNSNLQATNSTLSLEGISKESPALNTGRGLSLLSEVKNGPSPFNQAIVSPVANQNSNAFHLSEPLSNSNGQPFKIDLTGVQPNNVHTPAPAIGQNQTLLQQLQQIIDSGNETGTVTIEASGSSYSFQYRGVADAKLGDIASSQAQETGKFGEKTGQKIPSLRQDMLGQYFDAKLNTKEQGDSSPNPQSKDQQNSTSSQKSSGSLQVNSSVLHEQSNSFQNFSSLIQDIQGNQSQGTAKQVILPSGTVIDGDNVFQQVAERFQINARANDIKVNLKLHPEELGELKIDLTLKEGSIKGNVVAQSQQIQEIIERNIMKLRSILEEQGFTVEEIVVSSESDSVTDFELFEQHLSQQNDLTPSFTNAQQDNDFEIALEDAVVQSVDSSTGVNIKA